MKNQIILIAAGATIASTIAYLFLNKTWFKNKTRDLATSVVADKTGIKKHIVKKAVDHIAK
jgi:hypothetical protein